MKKTFLSLLLINLSFLIFALPGFTSYIEDRPGEYVYYRDYSFTRESYIGILTYDASTYEIRYYAPADGTTLQPEKAISLAVAINPESDHWDMIGEKVIAGISDDPNDIDILNYMHDILYEFSSRRIHLGDLNPETNENYKTTNSTNMLEQGITDGQEYEQFGGSVFVKFNPIIPLFNIKSIKGSDDTLLLDCVTIGSIRSGDDPAFRNFKGLKKTTKTELEKNFKNKAKTVKIASESKQNFTIDQNWEQPLANIWNLGNEAVITTFTFDSFSDIPAKDSKMLIRYLLASSADAYTDISTAEVLTDKKNKQFKITCDTYQTSGTAIKNTKYLQDSANPLYFSLAVYAEGFEARSAYYNKILKSYKIK